LVVLRHNDMCREWHDLCATALTPSAVTDEPEIYIGRDAATGGPQGTTGSTTTIADRGDIAAHGFWNRGTTTVFDIRVTDVDSPSYRGSPAARVLLNQEKAKKGKYLQACLAQRRHFTPLVFSVDGMMAKEATAATRRVAALLAAKWKRTYSQVCGFVRSRQSIALARAASLLLRGARNPLARARGPVWDNVAGLALYN